MMNHSTSTNIISPIQELLPLSSWKNFWFALCFSYDIRPIDGITKLGFAVQNYFMLEQKLRRNLESLNNKSKTMSESKR